MTGEAGEAGGAEAMRGQAGPVWLRIAADLAAGISARRFEEGAPLPTALALAAQYGVHRHTVRQAFRHLQEQGLVSVQQGRGTFVTGARLPYRLGRRVRLREAAERAGVSAESVVLTSDIEPADEAVAAALGLRPETPMLLLSTRSAAGGTPFSCSRHWLEAARFHDADRVIAETGGSFTAAMRAFGIADYVRISTRITARGAGPSESEALCVETGAPVLVSRAVDATPDGAPFHLVETVFAAGRVEFIVGED